MRVGSFAQRKKRFYLPETKTSKDAPLKLNPPSFYLIESSKQKPLSNIFDFVVQYICHVNPNIDEFRNFFCLIPILVKTLSSNI